MFRAAYRRTNGVVVASFAEHKIEKLRIGSIEAPYRREGWLLRITYEYVVERRLYVSQDYGIMDYLDDLHAEQDAQEIVSRFPAGKKVDVFYDPRNPRKAVLTQELSARDVSMSLLVCAGMLFIGAMLVCLGKPPLSKPSVGRGNA